MNSTLNTMYQKYRAEAREWIKLARKTDCLYWRDAHLQRALWCRKMARTVKR